MGALRAEESMTVIKNFALFFEEKEGSTAVVQCLDALESVSVVRRETESGLGGWEPFEWFNCGSLGPDRFRRCLDLIYGKRPLDLGRLNEIYTATARAPLRPFDASGTVGFKMRITPPWDIPDLPAASRYRKLKAVDVLCRAIRRSGRNAFKRLMGESLSSLGVVVLVMVRQDVFRWAISKYHGDGTGKPGHLQFRMAAGGATAGALPRIRIDPRRFGRIVDKCVQLHRTKRWWFDAMQAAGVQAYPLLYEEFAGDRLAFFTDLAAKLGISSGTQEIAERISGGTRLKRVHGSDISDYVVNHQEITDLYGDRFVKW